MYVPILFCSVYMTFDLLMHAGLRHFLHCPVESGDPETVCRYVHMFIQYKSRLFRCVFDLPETSIALCYDFIKRTFDFIARSEAAHMTCST